MNNLKLILKGILIGVGKIIPGVSGGVIAISMGIYDKAIYAINNIFKDFKNNYKLLLFLFIGFFISMMFMCDIVIVFLDKFYFPTMFLFVGLILGSLFNLNKEIKNNHFFITLICFLLVVILGIFTKNNMISFTNNKYKVLFFLTVGIIEAVTMIVPGISGTAVLMMLGCYKVLMESLALFTQFDIVNADFLIILPFFLGIIIGGFVTIKLINILFKKYNSQTYSAIFGFSYGTIVIMLLKALNSTYNFYEYIVGVFLLIISFYIMRKINHS